MIFILAITMLATSFPFPSSATGDEFATGSAAFPTGPRGAFSGVSADNMFDGSDSTATTTTGGTRVYSIIFPAGQTKAINFFRIKGDVSGGGNTLVTLECYTTGGTGWSWANDPAWGANYNSGARWAAGSSNDTGLFSTPRMSGTCYQVDLTIFGYGAGQSVGIYSLEGYTTTGPASRPITNYIKNLRASHPPFERTYTWEWIGGWTGPWDVKNVAGNVLLSGVGPVGFSPGFTVHCPVVCGADTYTITINDAAGFIATYAIDGAADGTLIAQVTVPHVTRAVACYQATSGQCGALGGEWAWGTGFPTVGAVLVNYTFSGDAGYTYNVKAGQGSLTAPPPAMASVGASGTRMPGTYSLFIGAGSITTLNDPHLILTVDNGVGDLSLAVMDLTFSTGGATVPVVNLPIALPETCGAVDPACAIRQIFAVAGEAFRFAVFDSVYGLRSTMLSRQPFNLIARAYSGVSAQIARAQAATSSTSICDGIPIPIPAPPSLPHTVLPGGDTWAIPTVAPFLPASGFGIPGGTMPSAHLLACADLEPWGGTAWWQAFRTMLDPALYLAYAYGWVRKLTPTTTIQG